jgi:protein involved in polysaccharide export with SLBB domain
MLVKALFVKWFFFLFTLVFIGAEIVPPGCFAQETDRTIHLVRGDAIRLSVYDGPFTVEKNRFLAQFNEQEFIIDGFGNIRLLSLGEFKIVGMTPEKVAETLRDKFAPYATEEPILIVEPLIRVVLQGEFGKPGMYRFNPFISFWEMVELAGGFGALASMENVYILRKNDILYRDFTEALFQGQSLYELGVESGDVITAPRVSRLTFQSIMRYAGFGMSLITVYFTLMNYQARRK